jgi:general secretion pathway protein A
MYIDYFGFREEPFADIADLRFFYTNAIYKKAYATLLSGIREHKGFLLLTGEAGTGKTTILRRVMQDLESAGHYLFFDSTRLTCSSIDDLLYFICTQLGLLSNGSGQAEKLHAFSTYLNTLGNNGGTGVLLIDEAHHLSEMVLGGLRMIMPLDIKSERLLLQIVLVGQPELEVKLEQPKLRPIHQRIALRCHLTPFPDQEVPRYIHHRLQVVGCERQDLFTPEAMQQIAVSSKGLPRLINIICDNALLLTHGKSQRVVSAAIVDEVIANLRLAPSPNGAPDADHTERSLTSSVIVPVQNFVPELPRHAQLSPILQQTATPLFSRVKSNSVLYLAAGFFLVLTLGFFIYRQQEDNAAWRVPPVPENEQLQPPQRRMRLARPNRALAITQPAPSGQTATTPTEVVPQSETRAERRPSAPQITRVQPSGQELRVTVGQALIFIVEVANLQPGLRYAWFLDGQEQGRGSTWTYAAQQVEGGRQRTVTVQISDAHRHVVERSWKIHIQNADRRPPTRKGNSTGETSGRSEGHGS